MGRITGRSAGVQHGNVHPSGNWFEKGGTRTHTRGEIPEVKRTEDESFRSRSQRCSLNGCAAVANFVTSKKQDRLEGRSQRGCHLTGQPHTLLLPPCGMTGAWGNVLLPTVKGLSASTAPDTLSAFHTQGNCLNISECHLCP